MTTRITVDAKHSGWPVKFTRVELDEKGNATGNTSDDYVRPGHDGTFSVSENSDLRIHEMRQDERLPEPLTTSL
jgi:hypothetical protein